MSDVRTATAPDTTPELVRLAVIHLVLVIVPVLVIGVVVLPVVLALVLALVVGVAATALRLRGIDRKVATAIGAVPVGDDELPRLHSVVDSVAMAIGVAAPSLFTIDDPARNAITWGDGTGPVSAAFTTGLLGAVDRVELEALVGRQLCVARDAPSDVVTVASVLFGPLARGPFEEVVAALVHRTVDDRGVVMADLDGVRATRYPPGLVSALAKVRDGSSTVAGVPPSMSVLCFAAPHHDGGRFEVHPSIEDRIDLLREI